MSIAQILVGFQNAVVYYLHSGTLTNDGTNGLESFGYSSGSYGTYTQGTGATLTTLGYDDTIDLTLVTFSAALAGDPANISVTKNGSTVVYCDRISAGTYEGGSNLFALNGSGAVSEAYTVLAAAIKATYPNLANLGAGQMDGTNSVGNVDVTGTLTITVYSGGTWNVNNSVTSANQNGSWAVNPAAGIGDNFWVRFTRTAQTITGNGSASTSTGWLQLNTNRSVNAAIATNPGSSSVANATWTIEIAADAAGANIVSTTTGIQLNIDSTYS